MSGAHTDPSITLAALSIGRVSPVETAGYLTAQCGGGIAGASAMLCLYGAHDYTDGGYDRMAVECGCDGVHTQLYDGHSVPHSY